MNLTNNMDIKQIKNFIGTAKYDPMGQYIWGVDEKGNYQKIADVRGWGAIQHMFANNEEAAKFQDDLGQFITDAINNKIKTDGNTKQ